jgi:2'-5' RNA ligase
MAPDDRERPRTLRLFVAIELPDETKRELTRTIERLRDAIGGDALRWVRPEGIHVTLKFLGAVEPERVEAIQTALRIGLRDVDAFTLRPEGAGSFGGRRNLRVVWVGVGGEVEALARAASAVEGALAPLGFPTEQRAFNAHLTLARIRDDAPASERERVHAALGAFRAPAFAAFHVEHVSLMRSTLGRGGAVYDAIGAFALRRTGGNRGP